MDEALIRSADKVGAYLIKKENTIAVAESVTSGNVQAIFSLAKNAISFYQGGITVYNIGQKCRHLLVEPTHAISCNCVSQRVSDEMALGVETMFRADIGVGITGYASPVPEENISKLFAFISISRNGKVILRKKINGPQGAPHAVQLHYTEQLLKLLATALKVK